MDVVSIIYNVHFKLIMLLISSAEEPVISLNKMDVILLLCKYSHVCYCQIIVVLW